MPDDVPGLAWFEQQAHQTVAAFPSGVVEVAQEVAIRVEDWSDKTMMRELGLQERHLLTGLYDGVPITEKSVFDQP